MDVFSAFPQAIVSGVWEIGTVARATELGNVYTTLNSLDVIVDEESDTSIVETPDADYLETGTLLYVKPSQLPTLDSSALASDYLVKNTELGQIYRIKKAGIGKNQELGQIEHVELLIESMEALEDGE